MLGLTCLCLVLAQGQAPGDDSAEKAPTLPEARTTTHTIELGGREWAYQATADTLELAEEDGTERAHVFHVSYVLDAGVEDAERPLTFCFNGGPGSSSVWLHLGVFGPKRVEMADAGQPVVGPPYRWLPNPHTLLDQSDLVFVDPPSTGYSRAAGDTEPSEFHGVEKDVRWMAEFIRLYVTRHTRWDSPKFLAGESYGTTRVVGLARELFDKHGMALNGLVLVSSILDFQTARFDDGNDLPYVLFLPTYTATAFYHGRLTGPLAENLDRTLEAAEAFASGDYASALFAGSRTSAEERARVAERLAQLTGLSSEYCLRCNLRPQIHRFCKELLRGDGLTVGRLDSRFTGWDRDASRESYEFDPSMAAIKGPFTGALNAYVREELGFESDTPYEILTGRVHPWEWTGRGQSYVAMGEALRKTMARNPRMRVFIASGRYDLATPYFATEYTVSHLGLPESELDRIELRDYESGHMMYIHEPSLVALDRDLAAFYGRSQGSR